MNPLNLLSIICLNLASLAHAWFLNKIIGLSASEKGLDYDKEPWCSIEGFWDVGLSDISGLTRMPQHSNIVPLTHLSNTEQGAREN